MNSMHPSPFPQQEICSRTSKDSEIKVPYVPGAPDIIFPPTTVNYSRTLILKSTSCQFPEIIGDPDAPQLNLTRCWLVRAMRHRNRSIESRLELPERYSLNSSVSWGTPNPRILSMLACSSGQVPGRRKFLHEELQRGRSVVAGLQDVGLALFENVIEKRGGVQDVALMLRIPARMRIRSGSNHPVTHRADLMDCALWLSLKSKTPLTTLRHDVANRANCARNTMPIILKGIEIVLLDLLSIFSRVRKSRAVVPFRGHQNPKHLG